MRGMRNRLRQRNLALREYCYLSILREDIRVALLDRRILLATTKTIRAVRRDPPVTRLVAASILRNLTSAAR